MQSARFERANEEPLPHFLHGSFRTACLIVREFGCSRQAPQRATAQHHAVRPDGVDIVYSFILWPEFHQRSEYVLAF